MGRKPQYGNYKNGNGYQYQEDLPERGPGAMWNCERRLSRVGKFFSMWNCEQVARGLLRCLTLSTFTWTCYIYCLSPHEIVELLNEKLHNRFSFHFFSITISFIHYDDVSSHCTRLIVVLRCWTIQLIDYFPICSLYSGIVDLLARC